MPLAEADVILLRADSVWPKKPKKPDISLYSFPLARQGQTELVAPVN